MMSITPANMKVFVRIVLKQVDSKDCLRKGKPVMKLPAGKVMEMYKITFEAVKASGEVVREMFMYVGPFDEESKLVIGFMPLERMCLEYARVRGVSCSAAFIKDISEW